MVLQHRYYLYQRTLPMHEYGVWLEIGCIRRFFVTAVPRANIRNKVALGLGMAYNHMPHSTCQCYNCSTAECIVSYS